MESLAIQCKLLREAKNAQLMTQWHLREKMSVNRALSVHQKMLKLPLNLKWALCHGFPFSIFHAVYQQIEYRSVDWDVGFVFRAV